MTGFTVVNYGNVVFARPDYVENPLLPSTLSDGSMAKPYPVLAPEGNPNTAPANPNHNPNGGLNSTFFYQPGNFNVAYDRSGDGKFEQSALYAASQLSFAVPGTSPARRPGRRRRPAGHSPAQPDYRRRDAGDLLAASPGRPERHDQQRQRVGAVRHAPGFRGGLDPQDAERHRSTSRTRACALQTLGTATLPVNFTSYNDASIGGPTNNNPDTTPHAGDWGGIVFRSYDEAIPANQVGFPVNGILVGANGGPAVSGADDAMSLINFTNIRYGGGAVPQGHQQFL